MRASSISSASSAGSAVTSARATSSATGSAGAPTRAHSSRASTPAIRPLPSSVARASVSVPAQRRWDTRASIERCSTLCSPSAGSTWAM